MTLPQPDSDWHAAHANRNANENTSNFAGFRSTVLVNFVQMFALTSIERTAIYTLWTIISHRDRSGMHWSDCGIHRMKSEQFSPINQIWIWRISNAKRWTTLLVVANRMATVDSSSCGCWCFSVAQTIINDRWSRAAAGFYTLINCVCWMFMGFGWWCWCACVHAGRFVFWIFPLCPCPASASSSHYCICLATKLYALPHTCRIQIDIYSPSTLHSMPTELRCIFLYSVCDMCDESVRTSNSKLCMSTRRRTLRSLAFTANQQRCYFTY